MGYLGRSPTAALSSSLLQDADKNTKVQVEESSNENIIRFDTNGSQHMELDAYGKLGLGTAASNNGKLYVINTQGITAAMIQQNTSGEKALLLQGGGTGTGVTLECQDSAAADTFTVKDNGDVTCVKGDIVFGTAGKGICLGVTSNTDANTLDDYEEGSWDITWSGSTGSAGSQSYHPDNSHYIKIGSLVIAHFSRSILNKGSWTGILYLNGLPFTSVASFEGQAFFSHYPSTNMDAAYRGGYVVPNSTYFRIQGGSRMDTQIPYSEIDNGYYFTGCAIYRAA